MDPRVAPGLLNATLVWTTVNPSGNPAVINFSR
jgi:hypothetical protein